MAKLMVAMTRNYDINGCITIIQIGLRNARVTPIKKISFYNYQIALSLLFSFLLSGLISFPGKLIGASPLHKGSSYSRARKLHAKGLETKAKNAFAAFRPNISVSQKPVSQKPVSQKPVSQKPVPNMPMPNMPMPNMPMPNMPMPNIVGPASPLPPLPRLSFGIPSNLWNLNPSTTMVVSFEVGQNGKPINLVLKESSGNADVDLMALKAVRKLHLSPLPNNTRTRHLTFLCEAFRQ